MSPRLCINLERSWTTNFQEIHVSGTTFLEVTNSARYSLRGSQTGTPRVNAKDLQWVTVRVLPILPERDRDP